MPPSSTATPQPDPRLGPGPWGIYVHVPWCRRRCPYCSFYVEVDRGPDHAAYTRAVLRDLAARRPAFDAHGPPSTLFFGGGTPSRLPAEHVHQIVQAARLGPHGEVSLEANPEDLDPATLEALRQAGVTRLSVGLQTFSPRFARLLNRASTVHQARQALERVARAGFDSWSADLIFGLPDQSLADLEQDLADLAAVSPPHVSLYGLTYEPGTPFERALQRGRFAEVPEDDWHAMVERIHEHLRDLGLHRYEISNYARPGHESRHNRLYWGDRPYLGLGPGAHGYRPDGRRTQQIADLARWQAGEPVQVEQPDPWQAATDLLISGLRGREGLERNRLRRRTGLALDDRVLHDLASAGMLTASPDRVALTPQGVPVADGIIEKLVDKLGAARGSGT